MAEISKIKVATGTYDLKDKTARDGLSQVVISQNETMLKLSKVKVTTSQFERLPGETFDDDKLQRAIDYASANGGVLLVDENLTLEGIDRNAGKYDWNGRVRIPSNFTLEFVDGGSMKIATNNRWGYGCLLLEGVENVVIKNGTFIGDRPSHDYSNTSYPTHEWGWGVVIYSCRNVLVEKCNFTDFTGDGLYIGVKHQEVSVNQTFDITVRNNVFTNNRRNSISLCSGKGVQLINNNFKCTLTDSQMVSPKSAIDIETENDGATLVGDVVVAGNTITGVQVGLQLLRCSNVSINNNVFTNCGYSSISYLDGSSVNFNGNTINGGHVLICQSFFTMSNNMMVSGNIYVNAQDMTGKTRIQNVVISGNTLSGFISFPQSDCDYTGCSINGNTQTQGAYFVIGSNTAVIRNLKISDNKTNGNNYYIYGCMIGCDITGNTVGETLYTCIEFIKVGSVKSGNNIIQNNVLKGYGTTQPNSYGVFLNDCARCLIQGNTFITPITVATTNLTGIYNWGGSNVIKDNTFKSSVTMTTKQYTGITNWDSNAVITGNVFYSISNNSLKNESGASLVTGCVNLVV